MLAGVVTAIQVAISIGVSLGLGSLNVVPLMMAVAGMFLGGHPPPDYDDAGDIEWEEPEGVYVPIRVSPPPPADQPPPMDAPPSAMIVDPDLPPQQAPPDDPLLSKPQEPPPDDPPEDPPDERIDGPTSPDALVDALPGDEIDTGLPATDDAIADAADPEDPDDPEEGKKPGRKKKKGKKCVPKPVPEIVGISDAHWTVERWLVEWYATHPFELEKIASTWVHDGPDGRPDGFKLGLSRCSPIKAAGFKSGDIINSVNGRTIGNIPQAIAAYFALRRETEFVVEITRKGGVHVTYYYTLIEDPNVDLHEKRKEWRDDLKEARQEYRDQKKEEKKKE